jgi:hypothetical protein
MSRKHMPLLVGGVVVLLLAMVLSYLLFSAQGRYADGAVGLTLAQGRLQRLSGRAVFPSEANVQTLGKQLGIYQDYLDGLYAAMSEGQQASKPMDRDGFRRMLEEELNRLLNTARVKGVAIAPDLSYGVQRYLAGTPPSEEELPRLVSQFESIIMLCDILYDAGIGELISVERTVFEKEAQAAPVEEEYGRRGMRNRSEGETATPSTELFQDPDGLFTKEHFVLSYRAQDPANRKVLDRLSQGAPFTVVTKVDISNPARLAVVAPKTEEPKAAPAKPVSASGWESAGSGGAESGEKKESEILPRELRVVAGQELPNIRLEVDVYHFTETAAVAAKEGEVIP